MNEPAFPYDVFLSHSVKDKAVVRPLVERFQTDDSELQPLAFCLQPFPGAPIQGALVQIPCFDVTRFPIYCARWN